MNRPRIIAALLIALNVAGWCFFVRERAAAKGESSETVVITNITVRHAAAPVVIRTNAFQWEQLESEDYRTYIGRLRAIGCPEQTIRDIVIADLQKTMAPRIQSINGPHEPPKYWKSQRKDLVPALDSLEKLEKKQAVDFEQRAIVQDLLGVDLAAERSRQKGEPDFYQERLGFLSPEKLERVRMTIEEANQEEVYLREKSWLENDELTPGELKQLREVQTQKDASIRALLTPEEFEQYNLWFSPSAYEVRNALSSIDGTEQDFLAIYQAQREFDAEWDGVDGTTLAGDQKAQYQQARAAYEKQIRDYLGPDRYQKFVEGRDPDFRQLQAALAQFSLKPEIATEVYGFKKTLESERARVLQDPALTAEQKQNTVQALSAETERSIVQVMGAKPYRYYTRTGSGKWIWGDLQAAVPQ